MQRYQTQIDQWAKFQNALRAEVLIEKSFCGPKVTLIKLTVIEFYNFFPRTSQLGHCNDFLKL
jgi:hypothetical protein